MTNFQTNLKNIDWDRALSQSSFQQKIIDTEIVQGQELKFIQTFHDEYEMTSPITGRHIVSGSIERARAHWEGFKVANRDVPTPYAVYRQADGNGDKIWYYKAMLNGKEVLYVHVSKKPYLNKHINPEFHYSKIKSLEELDTYHSYDNMIRLTENIYN